MSKVVITISDTDDGAINLKVDFYPPVKKGEQGTPAQYWAMNILQTAKQEASE